MMISPKSSMASSMFFGFKCCLASLKHKRELFDHVCDECDYITEQNYKHKIHFAA
jgi:hypothetical protein